MTWNWTAWRQWTMANGRVVSVVAASGLLAAAPVYWWLRSNPRYATPGDSAVCIAAVMERMIAPVESGDAWSEIEQYGFPITNVAGEIVYTYATNAVGLYASRTLFRDKLPGAINGMPRYDTFYTDGTRWRYLDLWRGNEVNSGAAAVDSKPYIAGTASPFSNDWQILTLGWWTNYVMRAASDVGDFDYQDAMPLYPTTNVLHQLARPLSAMRWIGTTGFPYLYDADDIYTVSVRWEGTSKWYSAATAWSDLLIEARADLAASPMYGDNTNGWTRVQLESHTVQAWCQQAGSARRAYVAEWVRATDLPIGDSGVADGLWQFRPAVSNLVRTVHEAAVFSTNDVLGAITRTDISGAFSFADGSGPTTFLPVNFLHGSLASVDIWETLAVSREASPDGTAAYTRKVHTWDGRLDSSQLDRVGVTNVVCGWQSGPSVFVVDFAFEHLTNAPAFWGTTCGIR